jgi:hypothetical protein
MVGAGGSGVWKVCNSFWAAQGMSHRLASGLSCSAQRPSTLFMKLCFLFNLSFCGNTATHHDFLIPFSASILEDFRTDPHSQQSPRYNSQMQEIPERHTTF